MQPYAQQQPYGGGMGNSGLGLMTGQQAQGDRGGWSPGIPGGWPGPAPNWKYGGGYSGGVSMGAPGGGLDVAGGAAPQQQWGGLQQWENGASAPYQLQTGQPSIPAAMGTGVAPMGTYVGGGMLGPWQQRMAGFGQMTR